ncbi:MAG: hypothetical protein LBS70_08620 [Candidatus Accumulibacter sp.]|jgi:RNA polymerase subunit RPABC4/transcription elongation factor Spt4|nr:hypothetical protein [Accumulibacter sp.]
MPLVPCRACEHQVDTSALACPQCGATNPGQEASNRLVPCRACRYEVDTSALGCPRCGATNPGHRISRQWLNVILTAIQFLIVAAVLGWGGWYAWKTAVPMVKEILGRPQTEQTAGERR